MIFTTSHSCSIRLILPVLLFTILSVLAGPGHAAAKLGMGFSTPDKAVESLMAAVKEGNKDRVVTVLGPGSQEIVSSGDAVMDRATRDRFVALYNQKHSIEEADGGKAILLVGNENFPFPVPLVKKGNAWYFDAEAGKEEILNRRIGRNELEVIDVMRAYVDAQHEYASVDRNNDSITEFAQKIRSTAGKHDGLYWPVKAGEKESPFGPLAAKATSEGYAKPKSEQPVPYHGYYFKILKAQGKSAPGGAFDYVVKGKMILGFGMVAYPAQYGNSGIMTFIVNQDGVVYQKNLGKDTARIAANMTRYDPDKSWKKVE